MRFRPGPMLGLIFTAALSLQAQTAANPIKLTVDLSDAPRKILHGSLTIPVSPGPLTLLYPQWIPGEHGPTGPVIDMVGLVITGNGQRIPWSRDAANMFAYHVNVPEGVIW